MKVEHTDFICLPVTDFERSKDFYVNTVGLKFSRTWGDLPAGEFETGNLTIALMEPKAFGQEFKPHSLPIAFRVDDVAAAKEELEAKGVEFQTDIIDSGVCHQAIFTDPDGNSLNIHHRYAPGPPTEDVEPPSPS